VLSLSNVIVAVELAHNLQILYSHIVPADAVSQNLLTNKMQGKIYKMQAINIITTAFLGPQKKAIKYLFK
jgi:hypothetical protein